MTNAINMENAVKSKSRTVRSKEMEKRGRKKGFFSTLGKKVLDEAAMVMMGASLILGVPQASNAYVSDDSFKGYYNTQTPGFFATRNVMGCPIFKMGVLSHERIMDKDYALALSLGSQVPVKFMPAPWADWSSKTCEMKRIIFPILGADYDWRVENNEGKTLWGRLESRKGTIGLGVYNDILKRDKGHKLSAFLEVLYSLGSCSKTTLEKSDDEKNSREVESSIEPLENKEMHIELTWGLFKKVNEVWGRPNSFSTDWFTEETHIAGISAFVDHIEEKTGQDCRINTKYGLELKVWILFLEAERNTSGNDKISVGFVFGWDTFTNK